MSLLLDALKKAEQSQQDSAVDSDHPDQLATESSDDLAASVDDYIAEYSEEEDVANDYNLDLAGEDNDSSDDAIEDFSIDLDFDEDQVNTLNNGFNEGTLLHESSESQLFHNLGNNGYKPGTNNKKILGGVAGLIVLFAILSTYIYQSLDNLNKPVTNPMSVAKTKTFNPIKPTQAKPMVENKSSINAINPIKTSAPEVGHKNNALKHTPTVAKHLEPVTSHLKHDPKNKDEMALKGNKPPLESLAAKTLDNPGIKIIKYSTRTTVDRQILNAYQLYRTNKIKEAQEIYQQVLSSDANQRDSLLGLAAIALRKKNYELAGHYYKTLLRLDPKDTAALTGLMSVQVTPSDASTIAHFKSLLRTQPGSAHLHYTLGNLYAAQQRWLEAQSAYFSAYRYDKNNAVYVYNLATSLDRLGQGNSAVPYYRLSLTLVKNKLNYANRSVVKRRIRQINNRR